MTAPAIDYRQRVGVPVEAEVGVLADVYRLALEKLENEGRRPAAPGDGTHTQENSADASHCRT